MGTRRSALGRGALHNNDRDLLGLGSAQHGQLDAVTRFGAAKCRYEFLCRRGFLTVERDHDVARLDACLRCRTWRRDLHGDHTTGAVDSQQPGNFWGQGGDIPTSPNHLDRPHFEPCSPTKCLPDDFDTKAENPAIRSARRTLITAITRRITQQRFTAAQAAAVFHLTGPRVTKLLQANIDEFTLDELVNLLPALELTIHIVPRPAQ